MKSASMGKIKMEDGKREMGNEERLKLVGLM
jgi:hypothetical protein